MQTRKASLQKNKKNSGYTLVEMIIYVGILSVISLVIVTTLLSFVTSYRKLTALRAVNNSALDAMERITRDMRLAKTVDEAHSTFGGGSGVLTLIAGNGSVSTTTKFYVENNIIKIDINGTYFGPLTLSNAIVNGLHFYEIDNGVSKAIKVDMTISDTAGTVSSTKSYHSTIILKG